MKPLGNNDWMMTLHWTGGGHRATDLDRDHYNYIIEADGTIIEGKNSPEDQRSTADGIYGQHTARLNTRNLGIGLCGMAGAKEFPFTPGPSPITEKSFRVAMGLMAKLAGAFAIPITPDRVITHAEAEPNLGIKQAGKWDITHLPWNPDIRGARQVGDYMRMLIREAMGDIGVKVKLLSTTPSTIQSGSRGRDVGQLQDDLTRLGYFNGRRDADFGPLTRAALVSFQADQGLLADGVAGPLTWAALEGAQPRAMRDVTAADLRGRGSETLAAGDKIDVAAGVAGVTATLTAVRDATDQAAGILPTLRALVIENWPLLIVGAALVAIVIWSQRIKQARVRDAQTGAHLGR